MCLFTSCGMQMICPAYQSAFILDEDQRREHYALFTLVDGDTVPKRPYGFHYTARGDSMMEKFIRGTEGKGFRVQAGRTHSFEKYGFTYKRRAQENLWVKIFTGKERPVLENPYLFERITKRKPFYKLDQLEMELVHFNTQKNDSIIKSIVNQGDTASYNQLIEEYNSLPSAVQVQYAPLLRGGFNVEQEEYNKRYEDYFLRLPEPPAPIDSQNLQALDADTLVSDTIPKKGIFGLFKRGAKRPVQDKTPKANKKRKDVGMKEEEDN